MRFSIFWSTPYLVLEKVNSKTDVTAIKSIKMTRSLLITGLGIFYLTVKIFTDIIILLIFKNNNKPKIMAAMD
jgi:hypothetical protein